VISSNRHLQRVPNALPLSLFPFGTTFAARPGYRPLAPASQYGAEQAALYDNELVLDVGGVCWGCDGEPLSVIDHHFEREGQFASASSGVLHKAALIQDKFWAMKPEII
jgi:hypothetical protein